MRRVLLYTAVTLDGYIARRNGSIDFLPSPPNSLMEFFNLIDVGIMGRKTLEAGVQMNGGKYDNNGIPCYVLSRTQPPHEIHGFTFTNQSPADLVAELREKPGKDIWLAGGGETLRSFLCDGLVDEFHLGVVPVLLGEGIPLFPPGFPQHDLELVENKTECHGQIALRYRRRTS